MLSRRFSLFLCCTVAFFSIWRLYPTAAYYYQPLDAPLTAEKAPAVFTQLAQVFERDEQAIAQWVTKTCQLLGHTPEHIKEDRRYGSWWIEFKTAEAAQQCAQALAQLTTTVEDQPLRVVVALPSKHSNAVYLERPSGVGCKVWKDTSAIRYEAADDTSKQSRRLFLEKQWQRALRSGQFLRRLHQQWQEKNWEQLEAFLPVFERFPVLLAQMKAFGEIDFTTVPAQHNRLKQLWESATSQHEHRPLFRETFFWEQGCATLPWEKGVQFALIAPLVPSILHDLDDLGGNWSAQERGLVWKEKTRGVVTGYLTFDPKQLTQWRAFRLVEYLNRYWGPQSDTFQKVAFPIYDDDEFSKASWETRSFCGHVACSDDRVTLTLYGMAPILQDLQSVSDTKQQSAQSDLQRLMHWLSQHGFNIEVRNQEKMCFVRHEAWRNFIDQTRLPIVSHRSDTQHRLELPLTTWARMQALFDEREQQRHTLLIRQRDQFETARIFSNTLRVAPPFTAPLWHSISMEMSRWIHGHRTNALRWGLDLSGGTRVRVELQDQAGEKVYERQKLLQAKDELYSRINHLGVADVHIKVNGDALNVEFPGYTDIAPEQMVKGSTMSFHIVNETFMGLHSPHRTVAQEWINTVLDDAKAQGYTSIQAINTFAKKRLAQPGVLTDKLRAAGLTIAEGYQHASEGQESLLLPLRDARRSEQGMLVYAGSALLGKELDRVHPLFDPTQGHSLFFSLQKQAQERFHQWTKKYAPTGLSQAQTHYTGGGWRMAMVLNDRVISAPQLQSPLQDRGTITGRFSQQEAAQLAADLQAGSLSFTPVIVAESRISPDLGLTERSQGLFASFGALLAVFVLMGWYYRFAGVIANIALLINMVFLLALIQSFDAVLTLPGIAALVLTMGMAVDTNVLIFERWREEYARLGSLSQSLTIAYQKAFVAIADANITTAAAAAILLQFDTGPVKGFALLLLLGIAATMVTALFMTYVFFTYYLEKHPLQLNFCTWFSSLEVSFLAWSRTIWVVSLLWIFSAGYVVVVQGDRLLSLDFKGGFSATVTTTELQSPAKIEQILQQHGVQATVRGFEHEPYHMRCEVSAPGTLSAALKMDMAKAVVTALQKEDIRLQESTEWLAQHWTTISSSFSAKMRWHALYAFISAAFFILCYITLRFEWAYAISAWSALKHTLLMTIATLLWLNFFGYPLTIDLHTIGAFMTILGYALNDTIVVFDRLRATLPAGGIGRKYVESALNKTLSRTLMTSATTLAVLCVLILFGGRTLYPFALTMGLGVFIGPFSTLFIAPSLLLTLKQKDAK